MCSKNCSQTEDMDWPGKENKTRSEFEKMKSLFPAFRWSDSGDSRVCKECSEKHDKIFFFSDDPIFPGYDKDCRCIAEPVDYDELEELGYLIQ